MTADLVGLFRRLSIGSRGSTAQRGNGGRRAGSHGAQQRQGQPPAHALVMPVTIERIGHRLAGVAHHLLDQPLVLGRELVGLLALRSLRKGRIGVEIAANIGAPPLHEVGSQPAALLFVLFARQIFRQLREIPIQESQQRAKGLFFAAMRGSGDQYQVAVPLLRKAGDELVALVPSAASLAAVGTGMRLVHDHQFGAGAQELVAAPLRLDEVSRDDGIGVALEERLRGVAVALQSRGGAGQHQFSIEVKLLL